MIQQKSPIFPHRLRQIGGSIVLAIAYYEMAEISRHLASTHQDVTPVWPPDGIAAGAVLLFGNWIGYGVLLGSFLANFWAFRDPTSFLSLVISTLPVLLIAIGTTLGTMLGVFLLRKTTNLRYPLERVTDVFKFLIFIGMVGPIINATVGVASLALSGKVPWRAYETVWLTWWISNVSGIFIVTPILLSWGQFIQKKRHPIWQWLSLNSTPGDYENLYHIPHSSVNSVRLRFWLSIVEPIILIGLVIFIGKVAFGEGYHLEYMLIPMLIWSAFRLGQLGATVLTFIVAAIAVIATVNGKGGFVTENLNLSLIQLQSFIGVITFTILVLTATIAYTCINFLVINTLNFRVKQRAEDSFAITLAPLSVQEIYAKADEPANGAVVLMSGMVRNQTDGKPVVSLEYQAYEPMALLVFSQIAADIRSLWTDVNRVVIYHRIGRLQVGEVSVLVAIGCPHRSEAFEACRYAIDTLKHNAPIWKKEWYSELDGKVSSSWVSIGACCPPYALPNTESVC